jgi:hypothetical protein
MASMPPTSGAARATEREALIAKAEEPVPLHRTPTDGRVGMNMLRVLAKA